MPLYDQTTLPIDVDQIRTVNNATKNTNTDVALTRTGVGGKASRARATEWTTSVTWDPIDAETKDGTGVTATVLGPDHRAGETPDKSIYVCPNVIGLNEIAGLESNTGYVKGHLLNEKLGGPGNDNRNLTAIPRATNTGGMKDHVEERLKTLVNIKRAWVSFTAKVTHADVAEVPKNKKTGQRRVRKHRYANKLVFTWHEFKDDGTGTPVVVPGTDGTVTLDVPPPAEYRSTDYSQASIKKTKHTNASYGVAKTGKQKDTVDPSSAIADLPWNAIILQDWDTAKKRADMIKIAATEIEQLGADKSKKMVDYLTETHDPKETELFQWIEKEVGRLEGDQSALPSTELEDKLDAYDVARTGRIKTVADNIEQFLIEEKCPDAAKRAQQFRDELGKHDPLESHRKLAIALLKRNQKLGKDKGELQDRVLDYSVGIETPMSPYSAWYESEQLDPEQSKREEEAAELERRKTGSTDKAPAKIDMPKRQKRVREERETHKPTKVAKDLGGHKPTRQVDRCMYVFDKLRETKTLPGDLAVLGLIDGHASKMLSAYVVGDNDLITRETVAPWMRGLERDRPETFVAIARALHGLPSVKALFEEAAIKFS
jgi:hypothetical protein